MAELISSYVASVTTDISPWIPCGLSMGSVILCLILLILIPDPRKSHHYLKSLANPETRSGSESSISASTTSKNILANGLFSAISHPNIRLVIPVFLVGIFRYATLNFLIQYASIRFHIKISTGAKFYTETAIINIFLFLFAIPRLTSHVRLKYNLPPHAIDLFLVRTSVTLMCLGCLAIGLAPSAQTLPIGKIILGFLFEMLTQFEGSSSSLQASEAVSQLSLWSHTGYHLMQKRLCTQQSLFSKVLDTPSAIP